MTAYLAGRAPDTGGRPWYELSTHHRWLAVEAERLLDFGQNSALPGGFGWLDDGGTVMSDRGVQSWITTRMTYAFSLAALWGRPGAADLARHGLEALQTTLHDDVHGGWFSIVSAGEVLDDRKKAYEHAFVVLAASAATIAGLSGAREVLTEALEVIDRHFWSRTDGLAADLYDRSFTVLDSYRGANANMHLTEAYLAAADATGDEVYTERALSIAEQLINGHAQEHDWRLPEHYTDSWQPVLEHHRDQPRHPYQPFGVTPGHLLEWSRLLICLHTSLTVAPAWLLNHAVQLFERGVGDGWDGNLGGLRYTVDFAGKTSVADRLHWVAAEGIGAAGTLSSLLGDPGYERWYRQLWDWSETHLIDRDRGSWLHELDEAGRPSQLTWPGKPDVYHALQATLVARLPAVSSFARGIAEGQLRA
jgi:mannose/cellobiose epimerase-like protein (N-acyl-D-glucosamine 2-epimerase family)